jgi:hypothetical protein
MQQLWHIARWVILVLALAYLGLVIYAYPHDHQAHLDAAAVAKIRSQKITAADIDGSHLPPPPDPTLANATIAGVDANDNGIRDDVELAIFAEYPTSSATSTAIRAAELQYAMDLQAKIVKVIDQTTWVAATQQEGRGYDCVLDSSSAPYATQLIDQVKSLVFNTDERRSRAGEIGKLSTSFSVLSEPDCDLVTRS